MQNYLALFSERSNADGNFKTVKTKPEIQSRKLSVREDMPLSCTSSLFRFTLTEQKQESTLEHPAREWTGLQLERGNSDPQSSETQRDPNASC